MSLIDLTGKRFGRLTVIKRDESSIKGHAKWLCLCDCGTQRTVLSQSLRTGLTQSCGCLHREGIGGLNRTHGLSHIHPLYDVWVGMRERCNNPNHKYFHNYGGRGIQVCARWNDFDVFVADMDERPSPKHSIDRIDNDKGYEPDNCRWATAKDQRMNQRSRADREKAVEEDDVPGADAAQI